MPSCGRGFGVSIQSCFSLSFFLFFLIFVSKFQERIDFDYRSFSNNMFLLRERNFDIYSRFSFFNNNRSRLFFRWKLIFSHIFFPFSRYFHQDIVYGVVAGFGITAGAHRLWAHKSYSAKTPLRIFLAYLYCMAGQVS